MSLRRLIPVRCPHCGHVARVLRWASLSITHHPDLYDAVATGTLWDHACAACGQSSQPITPLLYHDRDRRFMIALLPEGQPPPQGLRFQRFPGPLDGGYRFRVVRHLSSLIEKRTLLSMGLDDRAMESSKRFADGERHRLPAGTARLTFWCFNGGTPERPAWLRFHCWDDADRRVGWAFHSGRIWNQDAPRLTECFDRRDERYPPDPWREIDAEWIRRWSNNLPPLHTREPDDAFEPTPIAEVKRPGASKAIDHALDQAIDDASRQPLTPDEIRRIEDEDAWINSKPWGPEPTDDELAARRRDRADGRPLDADDRAALITRLAHWPTDGASPGGLQSPSLSPSPSPSTTPLQVEIDDTPATGDTPAIDHAHEIDDLVGFELMLARLEPGDTLWWYDTPSETWEHLCGRAGYAIVRNDRLLAFYLTMMN